MTEPKKKIIVAVSDPVWRAALEEAVASYIGAVPVAGEGVLVTDDPESATDDFSTLVVVDKSGPPARLGALLDRIVRAAAARPGLQWPPGLTARFGPWRLAANESQLLHGETGRKIRLTEKERDIILVLHAAGKSAVPRNALLDAVWGFADGIETHTLETHIYRLRRKIEADPGKPAYLVTDEDGYRLADCL